MLHILRVAAVLGWLWARSQGGDFLLRIEDLDTARSRPELTEALLADLGWLGLTFDGVPVVQSQRLDLYRAAFERLRAAGRISPCHCTRSEFARAVSAPHGPSDEGPRYPGTCLLLSAEESAERARTRPPAWRSRRASTSPPVSRADRSETSDPTPRSCRRSRIRRGG